MPRRDAEYEVLLSEDVDDSEGTQSPPHAGSEKTWLPPSNTRPSPSGSSSSLSPLALWLGALVLVIAAADLAAVAYTARLASTVFAPKLQESVARLEYASPYIGLKELYATGQVNASALEPLTIRPRISAQVFVREPDRPAPRGERDYWHETYGRMSPNERRLQVSPDVHTIMQFRAIDFGMEDCRLVLTLPALGEQLESGASLALTPGSRIELFHLDTQKRPVDVQALTYRSRPRSQGSIGAPVELSGRGGDTELYKFPCAWSSLHAFEVRCAEGSECALDVWSSHNTTYGINMIQHQTV